MLNVSPFQKFQRIPSGRDWDRFQHFSRRVRRLTVDQRTTKSRRKCLDSSVFSEIARTCPIQGVFPNLQSLTWNACTQKQHFSVVFMHSRIRRFEVRLHRSNSPTTASYLQEVRTRMPRLTHLTMHFDLPIREIESDIISLLQGLRNLRSFIAPMYCLTSDIVTELSTLQELDEMALGSPIEAGNGNRTDVVDFSPALKEGAFPVARRICFAAELCDAERFFRNPFSLAHLSHLYIHALNATSSSTLGRCFTAISDRCPFLAELHIDFMISPGSPIRIPAPPVTTRADIKCFRPLFACRHLTTFELRWDYPLNLTDDDIYEFTSSWPSLEFLLLNCEPIIEFTKPSLTLGALIPLASRCPQLRVLGLYIDADRLPFNDHALPRFAKLQKLHVGVSNISRVEPAALFLSKICPLSCTIISGLRWPDAFGIALDHAGIVDERRTHITESWVRWNEVAKVLPMIIKARIDETTRSAESSRKWEQDKVHNMSTSQRERDKMLMLELEVKALRNRLGLPSSEINSPSI